MASAMSPASSPASSATSATSAPDPPQPNSTQAAPIPIIGIDLGTTYSCVAFFRDGRVDVIPNQWGKRTTPSVVGYTDKGRLVGEAAVTRASKSPDSTIFAAKRYMGHNFNELKVQHNSRP